MPTRHCPPPILSSSVVAALFILQLAAALSLSSATAVLNTECGLIIPTNPLSAAGLATPFFLTAKNNSLCPCHQANPEQAVFVEAVILDLDTGALYRYTPLVLDLGTAPLVAAPEPLLPANYIAALWFGTNGASLTLLPADPLAAPHSLEEGYCVNGGGNDYSIFGRFAYCNAPAFFHAAERLIKKGLLVLPSRALARDGLLCPTVRDFSVVDETPSDGVLSTYLVTLNGDVLQNTPSNIDILVSAGTSYTVISNNKQDHALYSDAIAPALGCASWSVPDLTTGSLLNGSAAALNELFASHQNRAVLLLRPGPMARIIPQDPQVLNAQGGLDLNKWNAYRLGVNEFIRSNLLDLQVGANNGDYRLHYCHRLIRVGAPRLWQDSSFYESQPAPEFASAATTPNLLVYLVQRLLHTLSPEGLDCLNGLHLTPPFRILPGNIVTYHPSFNVSHQTTQHTPSRHLSSVIVRSSSSRTSSRHVNAAAVENDDATDYTLATGDATDTADVDVYTTEYQAMSASSSASSSHSTGSLVLAAVIGAVGGAFLAMVMVLLYRQVKHSRHGGGDLSDSPLPPSSSPRSSLSSSSSARVMSMQHQTSGGLAEAATLNDLEDPQTTQTARPPQSVAV